MSDYHGQQPDPPAYGTQPPPTSATATTSLVLGILSLVCLGLITGIPAMFLGRNATKEIDASDGAIGGRGVATAGFVTGMIGTVLSVLVLIAVVGVLAVAASIQNDLEDPCDVSTTSPC